MQGEESDPQLQGEQRNSLIQAQLPANIEEEHEKSRCRADS
jgi:hypothetical protein